MKRGLIATTVVVFIIFFVMGLIYKSRPIYKPISVLESYAKINDSIFIVFIADNKEERACGFIDHKSLSKNSGMLFIFDVPSVPRFWMKDMQFQ